MANPAAVDFALARDILGQAQHLFTSRRAGPFHIQPGEPLRAVVEPSDLFADPLQFLLQSADLAGVIRNVAPGDVPPPPTSGLPIPPLGGDPPPPPPPATTGDLNAVFNTVTDLTRVQPRLRVGVTWSVVRLLKADGTETKTVDELDIDVDDPSSLASPSLDVRLAPTRAFPLRVKAPDKLPELGDVVCLKPTVTLTLSETRLRVELPGLLTHVLPVLLPTVLVVAPHPNFGPDKDQPVGFAVPADSPISSLEMLQDTVARLREQLRPKGVGRFALWAAGLGFLSGLLTLPNPLVFVKGTKMEKLDAQGFTSGLNDRANAVALFGAPGAAATLSSRDRVNSKFSAQGGSDPGLLHLRVGLFGYVGCQDLKKTDVGTGHAKNAPRGELLPPQATLSHPGSPGGGAVDPPALPVTHFGGVTVAETDDNGEGFQDSITAWTFEDIDPKTGNPFQGTGPELVDALTGYQCPAPAAPVLEVFEDGAWTVFEPEPAQGANVG